MNRKNLPLLLMLVAGGVTCVITFVQKYSMPERLVSLFVVLLLFYILGSVLKWTLDYFDRQNQEKTEEEEEVVEKDAGPSEESPAEEEEDTEK